MTKIKPYDHRAMILHPLEWPKWPRLPLKRRIEGETWPEMAFLVADTRCMTPLGVGREKADPDKPFTIFLGLMFGDPKTMQTRTYMNVDSLLQEGWEVD